MFFCAILSQTDYELLNIFDHGTIVPVVFDDQNLQLHEIDIFRSKVHVSKADLASRPYEHIASKTVAPLNLVLFNVIVEKKYNGLKSNVT